MLREVTNGTAALEGPNGIWRVKRGDTVPGVRTLLSDYWRPRWRLGLTSYGEATMLEKLAAVGFFAQRGLLDDRFHESCQLS